MFRTPGSRAKFQLPPLETVPGGRLTFQSAVPIMTSTQSAKTTIYYTPYYNNWIPLFNGSKFVLTQFTELSVSTTDTIRNPSVIGSAKVNDWYIWSDASGLHLSHSVDWTSDTARSANNILVNGIWLNANNILNGPPAQRGTYIGTTRSNASSSLDFTLGSSASGGGSASINVWNCYNRVSLATTVLDSTTSWTYNSTTYRNVNNSSGNRISFIRGLDEDGVFANYIVTGSGGATGDLMIGISLDGTTPATANSYGSIGTSTSATSVLYAGIPGLGFHFLQAIEKQVTTTSTATCFGVVGGVSGTMALSAEFRY